MEPRAVLEVFVGPDCLACHTAREIFERVRRAGLPGLETRLIDLSEPGAERPGEIFAIPTYMLEGTIISLGNPTEQWLMELIDEVLG